MLNLSLKLLYMSFEEEHGLSDRKHKVAKKMNFGDGGKAWKEHAKKHKKELFHSCGCRKGSSHVCGK